MAVWPGISGVVSPHEIGPLDHGRMAWDIRGSSHLDHGRMVWDIRGSVPFVRLSPWTTTVWRGISEVVSPWTMQEVYHRLSLSVDMLTLLGYPWCKLKPPLSVYLEGVTHLKLGCEGRP